LSPIGKHSIRRRLSIAVARATLIAAIVIATIFAALDALSVENRFQKRINDLSNLASSSLALPLWNVDLKTVEELLDTILLDDAVVSVALMGDGNVKVLRSKPGYSSMSDMKHDSIRYHTSETPVSFENQKIGMVKLVLTRDELFDEVLLEILGTLAVIVLIALIILFVSFRITRSVVFEPLAQLEYSATAIANGNLEVDVPIAHDDEVGRLAASFTTMRDSIKDLISDLRNANSGLEQKVAERTEELKQSERRVSAVIDNIIDGVVTTNLRGRITSVNQTTNNIFGYGKDEILGQQVNFLIPNQHWDLFLKIIDNYIKNGDETGFNVENEIEGIRHDGSIFPAEVVFNVVKFKDSEFFSIIFRDITKRKEIDKLKSEFISTVSHELRTPLTSIKGSLSLIEGNALGEIPESAREMLVLAGRNADRLINLVNDILDMESLDDGKITFHFKKLSVADIINSAVETNLGVAERLNVTFDVQKPLPDLSISGDADRLSQVMANLLSNAAKFSPEGSSVDISAIQNDDCARVSVVDRGSGISKENRDRIFQRFSQVDSSDTRNVGGTGLGLAISQAVVANHQGLIDFISTEGEGSTFFFDIPLYTEPEDDQQIQT
jgi:PAS domain S-box-containing protein